MPEPYHLYSHTDITQSNDLSRLTVLEIAQAEEKIADLHLGAVAVAVTAAADHGVISKAHKFDNLANHFVSPPEGTQMEFVFQEKES